MAWRTLRGAGAAVFPGRYLLSLSDAQMAECIAAVGLKAGHAAKLRDYLKKEQERNR